MGHLEQTVNAIVQWYRVLAGNGPVRAITLAQIERFAAGVDLQMMADRQRDEISKATVATSPGSALHDGRVPVAPACSLLGYTRSPGAGMFRSKGRAKMLVISEPRPARVVIFATGAVCKRGITAFP